METLAPGRDIGKYRVVRRLNVGGMAEIYLAQARGIEGFAKYVVLKRILPQYAASDTFVKLFLNEARVTASLDHPNIASVYDIGAVDGVYFFSMEYLHGEDLGHILRELVARRERMPLDLALTIGASVAAGLHAAHEKKGTDAKPLGIVHRDVSPSNVVVTYDGGVKLVDFGVAKLTAQADLTRTGTLKGKVSYMSPEQCNNDPIDRRSDIFALGVLMYELTTQTRLFRTESEAATLRLVLEARIPPPSTRAADYPEELEPIVMKALARDREQRYSTARELQVALEEVARSRNLVTSTAALGEWMTRTFGPKLEPWMAAPAASREDAETDAELTQNIVRRPTLDRGPTLQSLPTDDGSPQRRPRLGLALRGWRLWTALTAAVVTAGLATGLTVYRWGASKLEASAPATISSMPSASSAASSASTSAATSPAAPGATSPATSAGMSNVQIAPVQNLPEPVATGRRSAGRRGNVRATAVEPRPEQFSNAFARKESQLLRCFATFPQAAAQAPQLSVRFQVGLDGKVNAADVLPAELANSALGRCVAQVALGAQFSAQPSPVTVRIPVTVRRVGSSGER